MKQMEVARNRKRKKKRKKGKKEGTQQDGTVSDKEKEEEDR